MFYNIVNKLFIALILTLTSKIVFGQMPFQQVISSTGSYYEDNHFSISSTTGEIISPPVVLPQNIYVSGFQQPSFSKSLYIVKTSQLRETGIYPNPVENILVIYGAENSGFSIYLFDPAGKLIYQNKASKSPYYLDFTGYSAGIYTLKISDVLNEKTFLLIKI